MVVLFAVVCLLAVIRSLPWSQFNGYDQSRQAFVALEMISDGVVWYPHLPTGLSASKPPLLGWISAGLFIITRSWECAWRLPSLVAFVAALLALFLIGRRVAGSVGGLVALAVFGLNMFSPRIAGLVRTDMLLALWVLLAGSLIWRQVSSGQDWRPRDQVMFAGVVLAGLFTKGPVLLAFILPGLLAFGLIERRSGGAKAWMGWLAWGGPVACLLLWAAVGCGYSPSFCESVIVNEFVRNSTGLRYGADGAPVMGGHWVSVATYPAQLLHRLLPWSLIAVVWPVADVRGRRRLMGDAGARWTVVWFLSGLVVMSLIPGKRADRIFPVVPPLAILGAYIVRYASWNPAWRLSRRRVVQMLVAGSAVAWGAYAVMASLGASSDEARGLRLFCDRVIAWERQQGCNARVVGPVLDDDQALPVYLRETRCPDIKAVLAEVGRGQTALVLRQEHLDELERVGCRYRTIATQTSWKPKGRQYFLVVVEDRPAEGSLRSPGPPPAAAK